MAEKTLLYRKLDELVETHLNQHPIWKSDFFRVLDDKTQDPKKVWEMLLVWTENMMAASYGFQGYVLNLAARAPVESVRRLLLMNAFEELGDIEYPGRSHFQMVCDLSRLIGVPEQYIGNGKPRLLPTSVKHVETHLAQCRETGAPFLHGLGMVFLIENLTRLEFQRVLVAFINWWEKGTGRPLSEFALGNGVAYFTANIEADDGHAEDVAEMIETTLHDVHGINVTNEAALAGPLAEIAAGMDESITLRMGFVQGCFVQVFNRP